MIGVLCLSSSVGLEVELFWRSLGGRLTGRADALETLFFGVEEDPDGEIVAGDDSTGLIDDMGNALDGGF